MPLPLPAVAIVNVSSWMLAEQLAVEPPFEPTQVHTHGPVPLTVVGVPELQRLVGVDVSVALLSEPQTPFIGFRLNVAVHDFAASIVTEPSVQSGSPLHPANEESPDGVAVSVTAVL